MKILIIDDERAIRNSFSGILEDEGYDVDVAENGQQGLELVEKEKYDVIFCDIKMPVMGGVETLKTYGYGNRFSSGYDISKCGSTNSGRLHQERCV